MADKSSQLAGLELIQRSGPGNSGMNTSFTFMSIEIKWFAAVAEKYLPQKKNTFLNQQN